jgi:hypothetical protein
MPDLQREAIQQQITDILGAVAKSPLMTRSGRSLALGPQKVGVQKNSDFGTE